MARTPSSMLALGTPLPAFLLPECDGGTVDSSSFVGTPVLVMFICNHCPFVIHVQSQLKSIGEDYRGSKLKIVAVNSNDPVQYPEDSFEKMKIKKRDAGYLFAYAFDETQKVARDFHAECTPDFYLFDANHKLVYRGQLDDSRPSNAVPVTGKDLRAAIEAVLQGRDVPTQQKPSLGCNIKWKPDA